MSIIKGDRKMELKLIDYNIGFIVSQSNQSIILGFHNSEKTVEITENSFGVEEQFLFNLNRKNGLLGIVVYKSDEYYIHIKSKKLILTKYINGTTKGSLEINFVKYDDRFKIKKTKYSYMLIDEIDNKNFVIDSNIFEIGHKTISQNPKRYDNDKILYLKFTYNNYFNFIEYNQDKNKISLKSINTSCFGNKELELTFSTANKLNIKTKNIQQQIKISELLNNKHLRLNSKFKGNISLPAFIRVGKRVFVIIENKINENIYIKFNSRINLMLKYSEFDVKNQYKHFLIKGTIEYKENPCPDSIMTSKGKIISKLEWKDSTNFIAKIKKTDILNLPNIHNTLYLSKNNEVLHPLKRYNIEKNPSKKIVYTTNVFKDKVLVARINMANNIALSVVPSLPVYNYFNKVKINLADKVIKNFKPFLPKKINLFFEKEASKIGESGSYVFEEVMKNPQNRSFNYYIIDKKAKGYKYMKAKWGKNVIKRFSFRHYLHVFLATSFISSELSSHVISGRLFEDKLNKKIQKTPLYFLQHGIMFAKPVDNPMAAGFHKKNISNNVVKNVISSDLEAEQFYKMGYEDSDLMKTGLPKFDGATLNSNANRITYMPTWRYWEEAEILNGNIKNTTYFKTFINLIKAFEDANLLHLLQITAHNKFSEFISESLPQYKSIICDDPTEALKNSKIFITDYSSIIYDAIYRGAYPVFYWKDKDYLIKNYQAIPPVNIDNAPGAIADSEQQLIKIIKNAIEKDCLIEKENLEKYRLINEFYDNQNSKRVINCLKEQKVL